ncbi:MAG: NAD(P)/FAD-dependent oxidoreductase [Actinomycetota bacterium]
MRVIVVGAGLSGLMAARSLVSSGHEVTVLDKGRSPGGRLATRRIAGARLDHGAQFFTVRSDTFRAHVDSWIANGIVHEWCRGFGTQDGHARYVGTGGMNTIAKHLAGGLDVRCDHLVFAIRQDGNGWQVQTDDAVDHPADAVILTAPVPQSFSLLFGAGIEMPAEMRGTDYDRTLGLLAVLDSDDHGVPAPGGVQNPDSSFQFIGDNKAKGVSDLPALTFHFSPGFSEARFDADPAEVHAELLEAAAPWLGRAGVIESQVKKWRFATPRRTWPDPCWVAPGLPLVLAGDACAGPKMEGAALSGLAAAAALADLA